MRDVLLFRCDSLYMCVCMLIYGACYDLQGSGAAVSDAGLVAPGASVGFLCHGLQGSGALYQGSGGCVMACKAAGYILLLGQGLRASVSGRRARRRAFFFFKAAPGKSQGRRGVVLNEPPKRARRARVCTRPREA